MKTVCQKDHCCGCKVCADACKQKAITVLDHIDAMNAVIDLEKCNSCGRCIKLCPNLAPTEKRVTISWQQGWAVSAVDRMESSSGGFATAIAKSFVRNGGIVCSCSFREGQFRFSFAEKEEEVKQFQGSKYVKSDPQGCYEEAMNYIKIGKELLFIGLPCQVAAMRNYVGREYEDRLYTVDLICHGTPSAKMLQRYLSGKQFDLAAMHDISFRHNNKFGIMQHGNPIVHGWLGDNYISSFLEGLTYTENCYSCQYATRMRVSDLTLGDSWGSEFAQDEVEKGISLALCQTEKGEKLLSQGDLALFKVDYEKAVQSNAQLQHPSKKPDNRDRFLQDIKRDVPFDRAYAYLYPKHYLKQKIKQVILHCKGKHK